MLVRPIRRVGDLLRLLPLVSPIRYFTYLHCPRINTYIERYNRTLQEEFIENNLDIIHDKALFSKALAEYLIFYNAQRPHKSLGLKSPLEFLVEQGGMPQMSLTHTTG